LRTKILGTGSNLPEKILTNADLEKIVDTTDEWIVSRSGIRERRVASDDLPSSDLALPAAKRAIEASGLKPEDIDAIIVATISPDMLFPSTACLLQNKLGCRQIPAFDISAGCTGFVYGLILADSLIKSNNAKNVLVVAVEELTKITDWEDRATCVLFGDGAGAAVVGVSDSDYKGIIGKFWTADGSFAHLLELPAGGSRFPATHETVDKKLHTLKMLGNETFKAAVRAMEEASLKGLEDAGISLEELDWLIPHQANIRIIEFTAKRLKMPSERVIITLEKYGNTSASSVAIALDETIRSGKIKPGDEVMLVAFGAGFTWGSVVIRL
jgi:3-oxoacyl-[acyl-carrier-protein] synthase-3